ncbi:MAG: hypothetical protein QXI60_03385 [Thermofilaceae archaeon]
MVLMDQKRKRRITKAELAQRLAECEAMLSALPANLLIQLSDIGEFVRLVDRSYRAHYGVLKGVEVEIKAYVVAVESTEWEEGRHKYRELKLVTLPASNVVAYERIYEREQLAEQEEATVEEMLTSLDAYANVQSEMGQEV